MNSVIKSLLPFIDVLLMPVVYLSACILKAIRQAGIQRLPLCKNVLMLVGVFPIRNHYYEPLFDSRLLRFPLDKERNLPGINWNIEEQINILDSFLFDEELKNISEDKIDDTTFYMNNTAFESGDAEYLYSLIRLKKPRKIIEVGSGHSTLMAIKAIEKNKVEIPGYKCQHTCIEPYEMPWLEKAPVDVIREKVEEVSSKIFSELEKDDILFIDSSHVIRPQGDVLFEYLELIPLLREGVIVHVHDIFSPRDYLKEWVVDDVRLWNEQYLLEAFLTCNQDWKIIGALNYLKHNHYQKLKKACPFLTESREPGSFYFQKVVNP
jgi:predicted O-methyltransferase YrrM